MNLSLIIILGVVSLNGVEVFVKIITYINFTSFVLLYISMARLHKIG
jgi:hypothetical protein